MKRLLAVLVLTLGITFAAATPAQAVNVWGCPNGIACIYTGYNGGGSVLQLSVGNFGVNNCINLTAITGWNDVVSSVTVDYGSSLDLALYDGAFCDASSTFAIKTGFHVTFTGTNAPFDNKASSFKILNLF